MLIINRKKRQKIKIGDDVEIEYLGQHKQFPNHARIAIHAPKRIAVVRTELEDNNDNKGESVDGR